MHNCFKIYLLFNIFQRYNSTTGMFTAASGGDGFYYFSTSLLGNEGEASRFEIQINGDVLCTVDLEQQQQSDDYLQSSCSAATYATQGNLVWFILYFIK